VLFRLVALEPCEEEKEGEESDAGEEDEGFGFRAGFDMEQDGECGEGGDNPDCAETEGPGADAAVKVEAAGGCQDDLGGKGEEPKANEDDVDADDPGADGGAIEARDEDAEGVADGDDEEHDQGKSGKGPLAALLEGGRSHVVEDIPTRVRRVGKIRSAGRGW